MTSRIPAAALADIQKLTGLTPKQADTVLQLICLPENGETAWWKHYNYIEKLGDGRGFTVTIFGACSGTGDLLMIFDALKKTAPAHPLLRYYDALKKSKGDNTSGITGMLKDIPALGEDQAWRAAVWAVYIDLYWKFAAAFAAKSGACAKRPGPVLATPLSKGFMLDTAINHGADMSSFNEVLKRMKRPDAADERAWLLDFMSTRRDMLKSGFQQLDTSKTGDRCELWKALVRYGNPCLHVPIEAHNGYWGKNVPVS